MTGSSISVRLDRQAAAALAKLEASGMSGSQAIRQALIEAAAARKRASVLAKEVAALEADEADRREIQNVADLMEGLRAPG